MTEPTVPKPNDSACGFRFFSESIRVRLCKWMCREDAATDDNTPYECDVPHPEECGIGKALNALYAYQQKAEPAADTQEPIAGA